VFAVLGYMLSYWAFLFMIEMRWFRGGFSVLKAVGLFSYMSIPTLVVSFFNVKLNNTYAYKRNFKSILVFSLVGLLGMLVHMWLEGEFRRMRNIDVKLAVLGIAFVGVFALSHLSYLIAYLTRKKNLNPNVLDDF